MFNLFRRARPKPLKPSLDDVDLDIRQIPEAIEIIDELPRIRWAAVRTAVEPYKNHPALDAIWTELAAQWLGILRDDLGGRYRVYRGRNLLMLGAGNPDAVKRMLALGDAAYERLESILSRTPQQRGFGQHAILLLDTPAVYYHYISHFYPESDREYGTSAGVHIKLDYRHTAINAAGSSWGWSRTMVHELTHNMVAHLPLPKWLNEGLAQTMEDIVPGNRPPMLKSRRVRAHQRYWTWFGIDRFWNGEAFRAGGGRRLSYELSEILFRNLVANRKRRHDIREFLSTANYKDAGAAACEKCFGCPLESLVEDFLGPGPWQPTSRPRPAPNPS